MDFLGTLWARVVATQPLPGVQPTAALAAVALALVVLAWPAVRLLGTMCHEGGHALVGLVVGRRLSSITLRSDTSGLTVTRGRSKGPGMVAMLLAGYPAPAIVGLALAWLAGQGHAAAVLWLLVALGAVMLVWIRNLYGLVALLSAVAAVGLATWYAPPILLGWIAIGLAWLFLFSGPRPIVELLGSRSTTSDAAQLAALTHVPRVLWSLVWLALTVAALLLGAFWMLPQAYAVLAGH